MEGSVGRGDGGEGWRGQWGEGMVEKCLVEKVVIVAIEREGWEDWRKRLN